MAGNDSFLVCCSAESGEPLWERAAGFTANSPAAASDGLVFASNFDGGLLAADLSGTLVWEVKLPSRLAGPPILADASHLVVATASHTFCLNPHDGGILWSHDSGGRSYRIAASGGAIVQSVSLPPSGRVLKSLSLEDGRPLWSNKPLPWLSDPCATGDTVFAGTGHEVHAYSLATGKLLTRHRLEAGSESPQPQRFLPDPSGNRLYFGTILGSLHATTLTLKPLWHLDLGIHELRCPPLCALTGKRLACLTAPGVLHRLDPATGAKLSRTDLRSRPDEGGLTTTADSLYIAHAATLRRIRL